ncbi:MAG: gliding motility-associated C-terminal domain-containing protein, partial [Cytophagales bacterium]|nr:gliding motility-associated C-terminal domain-containing protein [Cytophagales bacterium]
PKVVLPNVFTPNEDGRNDVLEIGNYTPYTGKLAISNRWGQIIYQSDHYSNQWKAEGQPDGIYYYSLDTGCEMAKGLVQVMR